MKQLKEIKKIIDRIYREQVKRLIARNVEVLKVYKQARMDLSAD